MNKRQPSQSALPGLAIDQGTTPIVGFLGYDVQYYLHGVEVFSFVLRNDEDLHDIIEHIGLLPMRDDMLLVRALTRKPNLHLSAVTLVYERMSDGSFNRMVFDNLIPERLRGLVKDKLEK